MQTSLKKWSRLDIGAIYRNREYENSSHTYQPLIGSLSRSYVLVLVTHILRSTVKKKERTKVYTCRKNILHISGTNERFSTSVVIEYRRDAEEEPTDILKRQPENYNGESSYISHR